MWHTFNKTSKKCVTISVSTWGWLIVKKEGENSLNIYLGKDGIYFSSFFVVSDFLLCYNAIVGDFYGFC